MDGNALFSPCGLYRYRLGRRWGTGRTLAVVGLNPSTATASVDDPTIRRCIGFARSWGFEALDMVNLYAWRATDPGQLVGMTHETMVGQGNLDHLAGAALFGTVLCAWGASPVTKTEHVRNVVSILRQHARELICLGLTAGGHPRHPLYVRGDTQPIPFLAAPFGWPDE